MKKNIDFEDFFESALKYLYNAEMQIRDSLALLSDSATIDELKKAFKDHMQETKHQIERIEKIFGSLGIDTKGSHVEGASGVVEKAKEKIQEMTFGGKNRGMGGILEYGKETIKHLKDSKAIDFALVGIGQTVEHFEVASYQMISLLAEKLGMDEFAAMLKDTLKEEQAMSDRLTKIANEKVHFEVPSYASV